MVDISTIYAKKLQLKNPFVVASSGLSARFSKIEELYNAGAGAIIMKSIFEEELDQSVATASNMHDYPEALEYMEHYMKSHAVQQHLDLLAECKDKLDIPVIASVNCYKTDSWINYATQLIDAGAAGIELNVMRLDTDKSQAWGIVENDLIQLVADFRKKLPGVLLTLKLGKYYSNIIRLVRDLHMAGVDGVTLFNRTYMPDIDIEQERVVAGSILSHPGELADSLRFSALIRGAVPELGIAISTGAKDGADLVKGLLAGADAVQYCSALYEGGADVVRESVAFLEEWMSKKQYQSIAEVRGRLAATRVDRANLYQRTQFMKYFASEDATPTDVLDFTNTHPDLPF